ncbi:hypothetical protein B0I35DRAFT_412411 [Stachybotrys elegans]|uniref:Uncharacterized protein n=1 Tax=Stachybotrys elegans TaxID=80388 RepID=A0A8K0SJ09_9HYPO|nr:hypothetical protein B0I35DRAFT_412411 [Stachybotrys elegans]
MAIESEYMSRRDSWPPTQVRLNPWLPAKDEPRPLLEDIDDDPLTYFLTPAPGLEDDHMDSVMMDFDAGIEDGSQPRGIVRSVSPSTLDGLARPKSRSASPDFDSDMATTDDEDDDDDEYVYFTGNNFKLLSLSDFAIDGVRRKRSAALNLPSRNSFPGPGYRGRTHLRGRPSPARSLSASRARPNHLWREPSPDVWSIEEETEEELISEMGGSMIKSDAGEGNEIVTEVTKGDKSEKKVRFVLPIA